MNQDGGRRRKTYSAAVIDEIKRNSMIYVGDSIERKQTDDPKRRVVVKQMCAHIEAPRAKQELLRF